ncbi:MAG: hypothetical protein COB02_14570 [Candidatus Cloacimonadota bacterium]|nr:MAG: hypothetical protein COB02_14570 [Candidatus Cloacimonadota bacterium]
MMESKFAWDLKNLPFIYKELDTPENENFIPNYLPLELIVDEKTGVLTQKKNELVEKTLEKAYKCGSVVAGVMDEESENTTYTSDFIDFLIESLGGKKIEGLKILEIGSGTGFLLSEVQKLGAEVLGVEPGNHCLNAKKKYNVKIINDFFPTEDLGFDYDIIIMSIVFEHFQNPSLFLKSLGKYLKKDGLLIISVPDTEPFIKSGDISILFHEHYSFFTKDTLDNTLKLGGFNPILGRIGKYGGLLLRASLQTEKTLLTRQEIQIGYDLAINYKRKSQVYNKKLKEFLLNVKKERKSLGIYVPSRFLNILYTCNIEGLDLRFFDDNPSIEGKYYPGFNIPIETKQDLIKKPTDIILIFSNSFGEKIKNNILSELEGKQIITWQELFEEK